ncbi:MAG: hypothetical protein LBR39_04665 [Coriobacteriales bacterium]|jgi:DNA-binding SARP family transcriptional activator|nr:hypothetical protein [Coriobacteriales bacterium]
MGTTNADQLLQQMLEHREVPRFIVAPAGMGRSALAREYAERNFAAAEVVWLEADANIVCELLLTASGQPATATSPSPSACAGCRLLVLNGLPQLPPAEAEQFSLALDEVLESGCEAIVICSPDADCYDLLQSDRLLIGSQDLLELHIQDGRWCREYLGNLLAGPLRCEIRAALALLILTRVGSCDELRDLGYQVSVELLDEVAQHCPLISVDISSGTYDATQCYLPAVERQLCLALCQAQRDADKDRAISTEELGSEEAARELCFDRLTGLSTWLFSRGERKRSMELLELVGRMLATEDWFAPDTVPALEIHNQATRDGRPAAWCHAQPQINEYVEPLQVRLFGDFEIIRGQSRLDDAILRRVKIRQLFFILALNKGKCVSRATLLSSIWPDKDEVHALDNFYTSWSRLGIILADGQHPCPYLSSNRQLCRLDMRYLQLDIVEFEQLARSVLFGLGPVEERLEKVMRMEQLYRGDILSFANENADVNQFREQYRVMLVDSMLAAAQLFAECGNQSYAIWFAQKALSADPSREDVYRTLMDLQEQAGQRTSAMRTFFNCKQYLANELGIMPSHRTTTLYQELILDKR